jgi:hypothetical protein
VDDFVASWQPDGSGLWTLAVNSGASHLGADGLGMEIRATAGAGPLPQPHAELHLAAALDLRDSEELRFWLRSSRPGSGEAAKPVYLAFEADTDPPSGTPWQRLLLVRSANVWELHRLWLGDMPGPLRQAVGYLRIVGLDGRLAFRAAVDDLVATAPQPVTDVDAALLARLDGIYQVDVLGTPTAVPAIFDVPEAAGTRTLPYILVTPWSVVPIADRGGDAEVVDNPTELGACIRPAPALVRLEYRVDVYAEKREQKSSLLERILPDLLRPLVVDDDLFALETFRPSWEEAAADIPPGRRPLFYRIFVPVETGPRIFSDAAAPFLVVGDLHDHSDAEVVSV